MRGITPIIAIILLLMITIALVGFAFVFLSGVFESVANATETQAVQQAKKFGENFRIDAIGGNRVVIRNLGTTDLSSLKFYVDGRDVNYTGPSSLEKGGIATFILDLNATPNPSSLQVSSPSKEVSRDVKALLYKPCASDSECALSDYCLNSTALRNYTTTACGSDGRCTQNYADIACASDKICENAACNPRCRGDVIPCSSAKIYSCSCYDAGTAYIISGCTVYDCDYPSCTGTATPCSSFTDQSSCVWQPTSAGNGAVYDSDNGVWHCGWVS